MKTRVDEHIAWGIIVGLVVGKPLGIMLATAFGFGSGSGVFPMGCRSVT